MKRLMILLLMLCSLWNPACAVPDPEEVAREVMQEAHPGYTMLAFDQWGSAAAAVLGKGEERILCVAEGHTGEWKLVVDNPRALPAGAKVSLFMDTDISLFWSISDVSTGEESVRQYSCFRGARQWGQVACIRQMIQPDGSLTERSCLWEDGQLQQLTEYYDENENFIRREVTASVPARWLGDYLTLENYDASIVPVAGGWADYDGWLNDNTLRRCAAEIAPEYTFVAGAAEDDGLEMLMQEANGTLRLVTCACVDGMPVTNISSALPQGTFYGWENFSDCVTINNRVAAAVRPYIDGAWGVDYTWPMGDEGDALFFGRNWISESSMISRSMFYVGDHPWNDMSITDWDTLPATMEEALAHLDPGRWAAVNNPDPADRLHLRERADKNSRSFGKYYNGTPVEVLEKGKTWTRVRIQGMNGWMMTQYLAFGKDAWAVRAAFPDLHFTEDAASFPVWKEDSIHTGKTAPSGDWTVKESVHYCIIGILGDEWYHIWFPDLDEGGYMRQSSFWEGNG